MSVTGTSVVLAPSAASFSLRTGDPAPYDEKMAAIVHRACHTFHILRALQPFWTPLKP